LPTEAEYVHPFVASPPAQIRAASRSASEAFSYPGGANRHFLIVLGPFGKFTSKLAECLNGAGARCSRVLLNGGDVYDWGFKNHLKFRGDLQEFDGWLSKTVLREAITDIIIYGDTHPYCVAAKGVAEARGLRLHVIEQGYFRPFWVTLEHGGVNGNSSLPREPKFYLNAAVGVPEPKEIWLPPLTPRAVRNIFLYHLAAILGRPAFPHFRAPYKYSALHQGVGHVVRYLHQKLFSNRHRADVARALVGEGPLFIGVLQRPGDSQLRIHSPFSSVCAFIEQVVASFADHACASARLLFKSHPLDHGLEPHRRSIVLAARAHGVADRVFFSDSGDLSTVLATAAGAVTVNSTAGLFTIEQGLPTMVLGNAIYDIQGLTHQSGLDRFWTAPEKPEPLLFQAFRRVVISQTQVGGAFASPHGVDLAAQGVAERLLHGAEHQNFQRTGS
jgi:capsular polysaccharide export protein